MGSCELHSYPGLLPARISATAHKAHKAATDIWADMGLQEMPDTDMYDSD